MNCQFTDGLLHFSLKIALALPSSHQLNRKTPRMPSKLAPLQLMSYASQVPVIGHVISWLGLVEDWQQLNWIKEWLDAPYLFPEIEIGPMKFDGRSYLPFFWGMLSYLFRCELFVSGKTRADFFWHLMKSKVKPFFVRPKFAFLRFCHTVF